MMGLVLGTEKFRFAYITLWSVIPMRTTPEEAILSTLFVKTKSMVVAEDLVTRVGSLH